MSLGDLSEIVRFSCLERLNSYKTNFKELILFHVGITDFFIKVFSAKEKLSKFRCL